MASHSIKILEMVFFDGSAGLRPVDRDRKKTAELLIPVSNFSFYSMSNPITPLQYPRDFIKDNNRIRIPRLNKVKLAMNFSITGLFGNYDVIHSLTSPYFRSIIKMLRKRNKSSKHIYSVLCDPILSIVENKNPEEFKVKKNWENQLICPEADAKSVYHMENFFIENADIITGNSLRICKKIKDLYGKDCYYFPNGVDVKFFNPENRFNRSFEKEELKILYVGSFQLRKQPTLIKCLAEHFPQHKFYCVGNGLLKTKLLAYSKKLHNLKIIPEKSPRIIRNFYLSADVFFFPSVWEGMPKVMLEAGSTGLPILASNETGHPELVKNNNTGFLFSSKKEMIEGLSKLEDPVTRKKLGRNIRQFVEKHFTIEITAKKYKKIISVLQN